MPEASQEMENYFNVIEENIKVAYNLAEKARKKGFDPEDNVDIPIARNMAERVAGLISAVAPQLKGTGMIKRIQELEKEFGSSSWEVALLIGEEVAKEKFCRFSDKKEAMETGVRVGFAYHTMGIVAAPLEGFTELKIKKRNDGKEYLAAFYSGPIRGAGGTAAAFSVILVDYIRKKMGYEAFDPTEDEVKRMITELHDYHERVSNLQYMPSDKEIEFLAKRLPVELNGDPTEQMEVSNYKDIPRAETNRIRGGMCLVFGEGISQKAPKLWKRLEKWGSRFGIDWSFLKDFLDLQKRIKAQETGKKSDQSQEKIRPNYTYIKDLVAGRPVLCHPMRTGGFRLRYGRCRTSGFSAAAMHPATQQILNKYVATGTQLKVERPGKAAALTVCDSIEGPIVKLENGDVIMLNTVAEAKEIEGKIKEILFLGDILFNYGDFSENGHILVPPGYCEEWYVRELEKATVDIFGNLDLEKLSELINISIENIDMFLKDPFKYKLAADAAFSVSEKLKIPLHPLYTFYWKSITKDEFMVLLEWLSKARIEKGAKEKTEKIIIPISDKPKRTLEKLGVPHSVIANENVVIEKNNAIALLKSLNLESDSDIENIRKKVQENSEKDVLEIINLISHVKIRDKGGVFIGARMGRPEKAKMRKLTGSPQVLFPVGSEGGRLRSFQSALEAGKINGDFPTHKCNKCDIETIYKVCHKCGERTKRIFLCKVCGPKEKETCPEHGPNLGYRKKSIEIKEYFESALKVLGLRDCPDLIKGVRGTSNKDHTPEHLIKGVLRAKNNIYVNKDGTTRYDMTELPITHFKPKEIRTSIEKLRELGYDKDIRGKDLKDPEQILEIKPQDIILSAAIEAIDESANDVLYRVGNFIDDLLKNLYKEKPFYKFKKKEDLIGHLVVGLAPHISTGTIGRIIGFSNTQGCYAHPMWHAALRRDCDGDECCVMLLMDALLNFSRQYLPDKRGGRTMDAPLVLTSKIVPAEVDDMVHGLDVVWSYPLEFYEAALAYKYPWEVDIEQIKKRLGTEKQYEKMGYTHPVSSINMGISCSAYKTLPSMEEKLKGQMELAERIRAVDTNDVARLVIEKHFLKDTKGNLRKFSTQQFRCSKCNEKYRRPPLVGKCTKCSGNLIFTVAEGSVIKYLEPSISLANKYDLPPYLKQSLDLLKMRIESVFGKEKERQEGLGKWFG
ncbi:MAG TPA: DNA polymerase II large subunit [Candidatus Nanoarchaeia archaeon]|nr:DNA polymerase II large subunit [Candidatus Nanoarchaeia archaeon]